MPPILLKTPDAPATDRQLYKLHELTGKDTREWKLTMQEASDKITELEDDSDIQVIQPEIGDKPFTEAHVTIVEGDQRSGKTCYAVGKIRDSYDKDCVRIYFEKLGMKVDVKAYYRKERVAKVKYDGEVKLYKIPESYKLWSPMRIFSLIHLYGIPFVYVPSYHHLIVWLKSGFISNGWLLMDEAHVGISARGSMTQMGRDFVAQNFQFGKSHLDVIIITHMARLVDWVARVVPTKRIHCTYDPNTRRVTYTMRKKGEAGTEEHSFDATQYWGNFRTDEKVNA